MYHYPLFNFYIDLEIVLYPFVFVESLHLATFIHILQITTIF